MLGNEIQRRRQKRRTCRFSYSSQRAQLPENLEFVCFCPKKVVEAQWTFPSLWLLLIDSSALKFLVFFCFPRSICTKRVLQTLESQTNSIAPPECRWISDNVGSSRCLNTSSPPLKRKHFCIVSSRSLYLL